MVCWCWYSASLSIPAEERSYFEQFHSDEVEGAPNHQTNALRFGRSLYALSLPWGGNLFVNFAWVICWTLVLVLSDSVIGVLLLIYFIGNFTQGHFALICNLTWWHIAYTLLHVLPSPVRYVEGLFRMSMGTIQYQKLKLANKFTVASYCSRSYNKLMWNEHFGHYIASLDICM